MKNVITRRDFLKLSAFSLAAAAFRPLGNLDQDFATGKVARVAIYSVSVYSQPDDKSEIVCQRYRDELVNIYYEVNSVKGPGYNPLWYRVWRGYIHSAHLQVVGYRLNQTVTALPKTGLLAEVTVPYTQAYLNPRATTWEPVYRLYYESLHWIVDIITGPDGKPWYLLKDELGGAKYAVNAAHLRPVTADMLTPVSPNVPPEKKRIEVSINRQTLIAYEGDNVIFQTRVSTGMQSINKAQFKIPTDTPMGTFHIESKMPSKHMGYGNLTNDLEAYELPGVPWVSFFEPITGVGFHGTYWHNNFGMTMSHGCVNMRTVEARWIFRWTTPTATIADWEHRGYGTLVTVT
jgi:lipoprotein-anchoring transpeptidase ErfK/SrfK